MARGAVSIAATAWGMLEAGSTPSRPCPVPWFAGCAGICSALEATKPEVSITSIREDDIALVVGGADCAGAADASFICPAFTWTVLTRTGFIGSEEPGIAEIAWLWITPLVSGAG